MTCSIYFACLVSSVLAGSGRLSREAFICTGDADERFGGEEDDEHRVCVRS